MKIQNVIQGTPEWHALRSDYFTASEAPAMMGASKQISRTELLHAKKTGLDKDVHWWVQKYLFDRGHEVETLARPIIERMIGEDLFPVVGSLGNLLASMDGMTMLADVLFEPNLAAASQSPRYAMLVGRLGLASYWRSSGRLPDICGGAGSAAFCQPARKVS